MDRYVTAGLFTFWVPGAPSLRVLSANMAFHDASRRRDRQATQYSSSWRAATLRELYPASIEVTGFAGGSASWQLDLPQGRQRPPHNHRNGVPAKQPHPATFPNRGNPWTSTSPSILELHRSSPWWTSTRSGKPTGS